MDTVSLANHFLIAMPAMADPNFSRTLTYICEHNADGAVGVIVNRPIDMTLGTLLERIDITCDNKTSVDAPSISAARCRPTVASYCIARRSIGIHNCASMTTWR